MNLRGIDSYLLSIQYGQLSPAVSPEHAIYRFFLKTYDLEKWGSRSLQVECKDEFKLAVCGFLFVPHTIWGLISDRLATTRHLSLFHKMDDLEIWGSRSIQAKCKNGFKLGSYGFLFALHTICALISNRLATAGHLLLFAMSEKG